MPADNAAQTGMIDSQILADDEALASNQTDLAGATDQRQQYISQLDQDRASYDPMSETGPRPEFKEPTPQDHMHDLMSGPVPLLMALGAIGGAFTKQHGMTMLASTNSMMKGVVQGNADAYSDARTQYDQKYQEFRDKSKTWLDVYKAYQTAYKGRIDADQRAVNGANASVGLFEKNAQVTKADIGRMISLRKSLEVSNAKMQAMSSKEVIDMIKRHQEDERLGISQQNANTNEGRLGLSKDKFKAGGSGKGGDSKEAVSMIDKMLGELDNNGAVTGLGGKIRRGAEMVTSTVNPGSATPATDFKTQAALLESQVTGLLKSKGGKMGADERKTLREGIDLIHEFGISGTIAKNKLLELKKVLQNNIGGDSSAPPSATGPDGKKIYYVNGKWGPAQ